MTREKPTHHDSLLGVSPLLRIFDQQPCQALGVSPPTTAISTRSKPANEESNSALVIFEATVGRVELKIDSQAKSRI